MARSGERYLAFLDGEEFEGAFSAFRIIVSLIEQVKFIKERIKSMYQYAGYANIRQRRDNKTYEFCFETPFFPFYRNRRYNYSLGEALLNFNQKDHPGKFGYKPFAPKYKINQRLFDIFMRSFLAEHLNADNPVRTFISTRQIPLIELVRQRVALGFKEVNGHKYFLTPKIINI